MIEAIEAIDRIGVLNGFDGSAHPLTRLSLIYAGNGRGKSTLAAVLTAAGSEDPAALDERQSLGTTKPAHVRLEILGTSKRVLNNGAWTGGPLQTRVFDTQFVDRNVHTGGEVNPAHRQGLLSIAIGTTAVEQEEKLEAAQALVAVAKGEVARIEAEVVAMAHGVDQSCTFEAFRKLEVPNAVDELVSAAESALNAGKNVAKIYELPVPAELKTIALDLSDLFEVLGTSLSSLHDEARGRVEDHISHMGAEPSQMEVKEWLRVGADLASGPNCPFCGQSTADIDLVDMYAEFFDSAYEALRDRLDRLNERLGATARERLQAQLNLEHERATIAATAWKTHVALSDFPTLSTITAKLSDFGQLVDELFGQKQKRFENSVDAGDRRSAIEAFAGDLPVLIEEVNTEIRQARKDIEAYRASLSGSSLTQLEENLAAARLAQLRATTDVQERLEKWKEARAEVRTRTTEANNARQASRDAMNATLGTFEAAINTHLENMQAAFRIENTAATFTGGTSRGNYALSLRGTSIDVSSGTPPFRIALSEGDKRTLAFAFFCAIVQKDQDLRGQVIIVDDPVTSLDKQRRTHTTNTLDDFSMRGAQVIVLAHDATYLREVREKCSRKEKDNHGDLRPSTELKLVRTASEDSSLAKHDLDRECESPYFRNHRQIQAFLDVEQMDGAPVTHNMAGQAIRPLVESYLHRRFPRHIPKSKKTLGAVIVCIKNAQPDHVLSYAKGIVPELEEINEFGQRYHHDTDSDTNSTEPDPDEVRTFAQRALNVVLGRP